MKRDVLMKGIIFCIIFSLILLAPIKVFGAFFSGKVETNQDKIKAGEEIEIKFYLQDYSDINDGLNAYKATLDYDSNIFENVEFEDFASQNLWEEFLYNENTHEFVAIKKAGSKTPEEVVSLKLKAKSDIKAGETTIKVKNIVASEGKEDIISNDTEVKIQVIANEYGNNTDNNNQSGSIDDDDKTEELPESGSVSDDEKPGKLPHTGSGSITSFILIAIEILIVIAIISKYKEKSITKKINKNSKLFMTILCFGIISAQLITNIYAAATKGELNDDGKIDYQDVTLLEQHLVHLKELEEDKKDVADMNNDGKLTVTDLSMLVKKIENSINYTATITSNLDSYYAKKNEEIEFKFEADVSNNAGIKSVVVNGTEYTVQRNDENLSEYTIKIKAQNKSGIQEIKFTKAVLDVGEEIKLNYTEKIEILKDAPTIDNYTLEENLDERKLIAKFDMIDNEQTVTSAIAEVYNEDDEKINTYNISVGANTIEIPTEEESKYTLNIYVSYDLDTNSLGEHDKDNTGTLSLTKDLEFIGDYQFSINNIQTYNINGDKTSTFEKAETIILNFDSSNVSKAVPRKIKINGQEYDVTEKDGIYSAEISGITEIGDKTLNIEEVTLSNGKKIEITNTTFTITIMKKVPSINNVNFSENVDTDKLQLSFNVQDEDNTISSIKYVITNNNEEIIAEKVVTGSNEINDEIDLNNILPKSYTLKVIATYNNGKDEIKDKVLYTNTITASDKVIVKDSKLSKTQVEKNEKITLTYTIETNKEENIEKIVINGIEANATKKDGKYSVTISVGNKAGAQDIKVTEFIFADGVEVTTNYVDTIEILKDKPVVNNYSATYNNDEKKVNFTFDLQDDDNAFISAKAVLEKQDGSTWKENVVNVNKNTFTLDVEENIEYTFEILVTYSRYSNGQNSVEEAIFTSSIQMIEEYNLQLSNIKTYTSKKVETKYFERNEGIIVSFESTNSSNYYIEKAMINGKEYTVQKNGNYYETNIDGFDSNGVKEIKIEKVYLNNSKELDVTQDNRTQIEILKLKPTIEKFEYTQSNDTSITLSFELVDTEDALEETKLTVTDENGQQLTTKENLHNGKNEITFNITESEKYLVKIVADYDLDTNQLTKGENEYHSQEILNEEITIEQELIELKDIESIQLYKKENNKAVVEYEVNVSEFKKEDYIVEITMKDLPKFYAEIKDTKVVDGKFILVLDYDNTVQYNGDKKSNNLEVKFGEINKNNIASNLSFEELIDRINANPTGEFQLTQDLDASTLNTKGNTIITIDFKGKLNGNGYTIKNLNKPLFNNLNGAEITNLVLDNANLSGSSCGILANYATATTVQNVHVTNSSINVSHSNGTGAFIGKIENGSIIEKSSATNIKVSGEKRVGGLVGFLNTGSKIDNCYVTGSVTGNNDAIGGIAGQDWSTASTIQNCYANIQYNVVNNWSNGGIIGYSGSSNIILKNNISLADGKAGARVVGTGYNSSSSNNYEITESNLSSNADNNRIKQISKNDINVDFFEQQLGWDSNIWRLDNVDATHLPTLKNDDPTDVGNETEQISEDTYIPDIARLKNMSNYQANKEITYSNIYKIMPFYDAKYIVYYGNKIEDDNLLSQSKIKMIIPYNNKDKIMVGLNTNNYDEIAKIKIVFEDEKTVDYNITFDKKINDVAIYDINDLGIKYNYNQFILNTNISTLQTIIDKAKSLDYTSDISTVTSEAESRLYTDYYTESVKDNLDEIILGILENVPEYNLYLDNEILKTKIEQDLLSDSKLEKIIYTYNYFDKWYHMEIGGIPLTNIIFTKVNDLNEDYSILSLTTATMNQSSSTRGTGSTVGFFNNVIKPELSNKDIGSFLEYFMRVLERYDNGNKWFEDHFEGILNQKPALGKEDAIRYQAWELLKARNNLLLPILSAPQEDMYIISVPSQLVIGSMNRYQQYLNGNIEGMKNLIDDYATKIGNFYGISSTFINNSENILNSHAHIQYDTRFYFPGTGDQSSGTTQDPVIKWVYEAVGAFAGANGSGAYANGTDVYWVVDTALGSDYAYRIFTHETAHNQDGYYFYEGQARRYDTWAEDHADCNIAQDLGDGSVVFNITRDKAITSDDSNNLTLERITGAENISTYYKEMFETYYVLDYLTGQAFLQLTPEEQAKVAVQVTYDGKTDYEEGGTNITYNKISADDFRDMNLEDMDDLWDNGIALRGTGSDSGKVPGSYGGDNHYSIYWYQPHNNNGRTGSHAFKRLGFEMLGVGGYSDGYVTFRSRKSSNDLDALRKITKDDNITWKKYKLNRYEQVKENLSKIPYFDANTVIEAYKQALEKDAVAGNRNNTNNLRRVLYGIVKRATKDFTTGSIYSLDEEIEITSAKQFIDVLNSSEWGNYKITKDLDFSDITSEGTSYISNTFVGRIDGNGHNITGLTKPLFSQIIYGEIQDLNINEPTYPENAQAILTITSKQMLLKDVVVNDSNIYLPFGAANQGVVQWLGTTAINTNEYEINSLEDFEKISADNLSKKMTYKLNVDLNVSSITNGSAIISGTFTGNIDGNNHKIYNLNLPLFDSLQGTVKNLAIENMNFNSSGTSSVGALAKTSNNATVENIKVNDVTINGRENLAGLVGVATNTTFNKITVDNINITGPRFYIGGIIGRSTNVTLSNARVTGQITIEATHNGGVIGAMNSGTLENVYSNVEIKRPRNSDSRNQNAGLVGSIEGGNPIIRNSIAIGNVAQDVYKAMGGISGKTAGQVASKKDYINNVYENSEATGISNTNEDNNIQAVDSSTFMTKAFYTETLKWSGEIWDFTNIANGPSIKF